MRHDDPDPSFENLVRLAVDDPAAFEAKRLALIEAVIASAPDAARPRLRGLQWQLDHLRDQHSPLGACLRISGMMWDSILDQAARLAQVARLEPEPGPVRNARILAFPGPRERR